MNFNYIIFKTFKANFKKFLSYFLCWSFSITIFFMYTTLILNNSITGSINSFGKEGTAINTMLYTSLITLILFSIIFMSYSHISFINCRKKEFKLYLILGMNKRNVKKLIIFENLFIVAISMLTGLISGSVFGRLFFMIVAKLLNLNAVAFSLSYENYLVTILSFIVIFNIVLAINSVKLNKINISKLISKNEALKSQVSIYAYLSVAGIVVMLLSYIIIYCSDKNGFNVILSTMLCFFGLYLFITYLGNLVLSSAKKKKKFYHSNLLNITEISYKFNQNKKIIFVLSILSCITIYFIGLSYSAYMETLKEANIENPYDLVYIKTSKTPVNLINDNNISNKKELQFITLNFSNKSSVKKNNSAEINIISQSQFNKFTSKNIHVNNGQFVTLTLNEIPEKYPWVKGNISLCDRLNNNYNLSYSYEIWKIIINPINLNIHMLIVNDNDYAAMINNEGSDFIKSYCAVNLNNWEKGKQYERKIRSLNSFSQVTSKYSSYELLKAQNNFFLFTMLFIGILFFICCGCTLSFKLFSQFEDTRNIYNKLRGIGIASIEMKKLIAFQFKIIFFVPAILGSTLGFLYILLQIKRTYYKEDLIIHSITIILIYICFQFIYYSLTEKKYFKLLNLH